MPESKNTKHSKANQSPSGRRGQGRKNRGALMVAAMAAMAAPLCWTGSAHGQDVNKGVASAAATMPSESAAGTFLLEPGKAQKLTRDYRIKMVNVLAPDVADVVTLNPDNPKELLVRAKKAGSTQLWIWDENNTSQVFDIVVQSDIETLRKQLKDLFPDSRITVDSAQGTLVLHGRAKTLEVAKQAVDLATPYAAGGKAENVQNLVEVAGGQQVMLQVRFAEVSKSAERQLGINFGGSDGKSFFGSNVGPNAFNASGGVPGTIGGPSEVAAQIFGQGAMGNVAFQYFISALQTNQLLRILAEPDLVATSGQEATFMAGGSIPYPVAQASSSGTTITIQWQDYGVNLNFVPIVLGDGRIRLKVMPQVSELDFAHAVVIPGTGTSVPALTKRKVETTVELGEGQTFAVAGLLQTDVTATSQQVPLLGDLPIIGELFRSVQYQKDETELVVLVTPVLVEGMNPGDVTEVPGGRWRDPTDAGLYFGHDLGGEAMDTSHGPQQQKGPAPRFHGEFGFHPAPTPASGK